MAVETHEFESFDKSRGKKDSLKKIEQEIKKEAEKKSIKEETHKSLDSLKKDVTKDVIENLTKLKWMKIVKWDELHHINHITSKDFHITWYDWTIKWMWDEANKIWPWDTIKMEWDKVYRLHNWTKVKIWYRKEDKKIVAVAKAPKEEGAKTTPPTWWDNTPAASAEKTNTPPSDNENWTTPQSPEEIIRHQYIIERTKGWIIMPWKNGEKITINTSLERQLLSDKANAKFKTISNVLDIWTYNAHKVAENDAFLDSTKNNINQKADLLIRKLNTTKNETFEDEKKYKEFINEVFKEIYKVEDDDRDIIDKEDMKKVYNLIINTNENNQKENILKIYNLMRVWLTPWDDWDSTIIKEKLSNELIEQNEFSFISQITNKIQNSNEIIHQEDIDPIIDSVNLPEVDRLNKKEFKETIKIKLQKIINKLNSQQIWQEEKIKTWYNNFIQKYNIDKKKFPIKKYKAMIINNSFANIAKNTILRLTLEASYDRWDEDETKKWMYADIVWLSEKWDFLHRTDYLSIADENIDFAEEIWATIATSLIPGWIAYVWAKWLFTLEKIWAMIKEWWVAGKTLKAWEFLTRTWFWYVWSEAYWSWKDDKWHWSWKWYWEFLALDWALSIAWKVTKFIKNWEWFKIRWKNILKTDNKLKRWIAYFSLTWATVESMVNIPRGLEWKDIEFSPLNWTKEDLTLVFMMIAMHWFWKWFEKYKVTKTPDDKIIVETVEETSQKAKKVEQYTKKPEDKTTKTEKKWAEKKAESWIEYGRKIIKLSRKIEKVRATHQWKLTWEFEKYNTRYQELYKKLDKKGITDEAWKGGERNKEIKKLDRKIAKEIIEQNRIKEAPKKQEPPEQTKEKEQLPKKEEETNPKQTEKGKEKERKPEEKTEIQELIPKEILKELEISIKRDLKLLEKWDNKWIIYDWLEVKRLENWDYKVWDTTYPKIEWAVKSIIKNWNHNKLIIEWWWKEIAKKRDRLKGKEFWKENSTFRVTKEWKLEKKWEDWWFKEVELSKLTEAEQNIILRKILGEKWFTKLDKTIEKYMNSKTKLKDTFNKEFFNRLKEKKWVKYADKVAWWTFGDAYKEWIKWTLKNWAWMQKLAVLRNILTWKNDTWLWGKWLLPSSYFISKWKMLAVWWLSWIQYALSDDKENYRLENIVINYFEIAMLWWLWIAIFEWLDYEYDIKNDIINIFETETSN